MKKCVLLTNEYPFRKGETFLESEIQYLCESFDQVIIIATNPKRNDAPTRRVPANATLIPLQGMTSRARYPVYSIRGLFGRFSYFRVREKGISHILLSLYSRGRAKAIAGKAIRSLKGIISENDEVVVYSYWFTYLAQAACMIREKLGKTAVKCVSRAHGYDIYWDRNSMGYMPFQEETIRLLNGVYPCSADGTVYLQNLYPLEKAKIHTSRLGTVDYGHGKYDVSDCITFATCCYFKPLKRMPLFAKAFVKLAQKYNCRWICIGDGDELSTVREIVREGKAEERVFFLGSLKNEDLMKFYKNNPVSYFCNVSTTEGLPVSVMEALSFGIPVIATDVGGTREIVDSGVGRLIQADLTEEVLCKEMEKEILLSADKYQEKRVQARARWMERVSAERNYRNWMRILTE